MRIEKQLGSYKSLDHRAYAKSLYEALRPLAQQFIFFVYKKRDRGEAIEILSRIQAVIYEVTGASKKGELNFVSDKDLNDFWELKPIFQEKGYVGIDL